MLLFTRLLAALLILSPSLRAEEFLPGVRRIVFLGDSITHAGHYVDNFEAWLLTRFPDRAFEIINVGLPSETVSGLSEEGHAGGKFPRPDLHERLERVLAQIKPDLVFACYGMNDGIYQPFSEERFARYQDGIRRLREKVAAADAQIVHLTPFVFDPVPIKGRTAPAGAEKQDQPFEGYDDVLDRYTAWLLARRAEGWRVIRPPHPARADPHGAARRRSEFSLCRRRCASQPRGPLDRDDGNRRHPCGQRAA